ncbi:ATP-grasp domain-containing protein [uncultured Tateyamaria sp.]|uniref:ATP-grasp domain-containing protein n=1 Tax=uncultured Tateyamaria sp. TaxID=455651 RepID=UPI002632F24C|nr:ATP-grasp domain-containing protein [uncultured Tateyamaria sp.]
MAVHLARLLNGAGVQVILADTFVSPISSKSRHCHKYLKLPSPRFEREACRDALLSAIRREGVEAIVPTCEEVFHLALIRQDLPIPVIAPSAEMLGIVHNKHSFITYARQLGLTVPNTRLLCAQEDVVQVGAQSRQLVLKPVWSRFANEVLIRPTAKDLRAVVPTPQDPWVAQDYVAGTELSVYAVAKQGRLVALSAYTSLYRAGKGAGVCFEPVAEPRVRDWVETFVNASTWDGQVSFDMILTPEDEVMPLECNPRATSGVHFFQDAQAFSRAFWGEGEVWPDIEGILGSRLAMGVYGLPQAIKAGRLGRFFRTLAATTDILDWPDDPEPRRAQIATLMTILRLAMRQRISPQQAATYDIEWNGPDQP